MSEQKKRIIKFIKMEKTNGQDFINLINSHFRDQPIINKKYKILKEEDKILFPLIENNESIIELVSILENKFNTDILSKEGILDINYKHKTLKEALKGKIPENFLSMIPKSYDSIGTLAIVEFDEFESLDNKEILKIKKQIAQAIIEMNNKIDSVFEKKSEIKGIYRLREISLLFGRNKTETLHKENNCSFKLDIKKCFFTPRLVYERNRIATSDIKENEIIIDLFAGVGPFSIQIAKLHKVQIHSFDINQEAYKYLKENIKMNKIIGKIFPYHKEISELRESQDSIRLLLDHQADRIIMNLPEHSLEFLDIACILMKNSGGILHIYQFSEKPDPIENAVKMLKTELRKLNWKIDEIINSKIVKAFSPKSDLVVINAKITKSEPNIH